MFFSTTHVFLSHEGFGKKVHLPLYLELLGFGRAKSLCAALIHLFNLEQFKTGRCARPPGYRHPDPDL
jgi:hypothetical protein